MNKRLFVAIDIPESIKDYFVRIQQDLQTTHYFKGTFVHRDHLHQTLCFLGNVNMKNIPMIIELLKEVKMTPFKLTLRHLGVFPTTDYISVIWIDLKGNELVSLAHAINYTLRDIRSEEKREFASHITLARVKSIATKEELLSFLENYKIDALEFTISEFVLKESVLTSHGPLHTTVETFVLNKN